MVACRTFLDRNAIADVVEAAEGRNDLFIMGDHDDRSFELPGHGVEQVDNGERADAVERRRRRRLT